MDKTLGGYSDELTRVDNSTLTFLRELDPRTTVQALPDWERMLGLPDECTGPTPTIQERRNAVLAKLAGQGGQSARYYVAVAEALGYTITIEEPFPWRFDRDTFEEPLYDETWSFWWIVNSAEFTIKSFTFDNSAFEEPFRFWSNTQLECVLGKLKPAHTRILFVYS